MTIAEGAGVMTTKDSIVHEHGRMHLRINPDAGTSWLLIENVNREGEREHWLTLTSLLDDEYTPIGYLRLRPVSPALHIFEVAELRPATGPLLRSPGGRPGSEHPSRTRSE